RARLRQGPGAREPRPRLAPRPAPRSVHDARREAGRGSAAARASERTRAAPYAGSVSHRLLNIVRARRQIAERLGAASGSEPPAEPAEHVAQVQAELEERRDRRVAVAPPERAGQVPREAPQVLQRLLHAAERHAEALVRRIARVAVTEQRGAV